MSANAADRFLNCVMKRSDSDSLFRIGAFLMITILAPAIAFVVMHEFLGSGSSIADTGVELVAWTAILYALYLEVKGLNLHLARDAEWADSLASYARFRGRGSDEIDSLAGSMRDAGNGRAMQVTKYTFLAMAVVNIAAAVLTGNRDIGVTSQSILTWAALILTVVEMAFTSAYILETITKHNFQQCKLTSLFVESMGGIINIGEMSTGAAKEKIDLLPHIILLMITLGVYSLFFNLFVLHRMNNHISCQWEYEERLLEEIAKAEGATDVRRIEVERKKVKAILGIFQ